MRNFNKNSIVVMLAFTLALGFTLPAPTHAATSPGLGVAASFSALGTTSVTNTGGTTLSGDVGVAPGTSITNGGTLTVGGVTHNNDATSIQAHSDLGTANTNMLGQGATSSQGPVLDGLTLIPGVYDIGAGRLNGGILHLNGAGVYIFRASSDFISSGSISLENGARACDVYWSVATLATINGSSFAGTIIAGSGVHFGSGVTLDGRALARGGDVTMISDNISGPTCVAAPGAPSSNGGGPLAAQVPPLIDITKIPTPLALPGGPGSVTYDYTLLNVGTVPINNVVVTDNKCSTISFISGDTNGDSKLDTSEVWKYRCTTNVSQTTTNTATARGDANGFTTIKTANATVVVGAPIIPPLIHLVKKPNIFLLPAGGGAVTYSYAVTNPGTAPLRNVSVIDNKCTGLPGLVSGNAGDINHNGLLDPGETWMFTCQTNLTETTTNTGTAEGSANGLTILDYSLATVVVAPPTLPKTGYPPQEKNNLWDTIIQKLFAPFF